MRDVANGIVAEVEQLALFLITSKYKRKIKVTDEEEITVKNQVQCFIKTRIKIYIIKENVNGRYNVYTYSSILLATFGHTYLAFC